MTSGGCNRTAPPWRGPGTRQLPGRWEFRRPDGTPLPSVVVPLTGNTESLIEMHTRTRLRVDRTTLTPDWDGERLDQDSCFPDSDFAAVARSLGARGATVACDTDLDAVADWLAAPDRPLVVDCKIEPSAMAPWFREVFALKEAQNRR